MIIPGFPTNYVIHIPAPIPNINLGYPTNKKRGWHDKNAGNKGAFGKSANNRTKK